MLCQIIPFLGFPSFLLCSFFFIAKKTRNTFNGRNKGNGGKGKRPTNKSSNLHNVSRSGSLTAKSRFGFKIHSRYNRAHISRFQLSDFDLRSRMIVVQMNVYIHRPIHTV